MKVDKYKALADYLDSTADELGLQVGKTVILPSSFQGSPRNCQQGYQDSMALVRTFGKPEYFITFTCNPKWREITDNLLPLQVAEDRPDIVDRVFKLKVKEFLYDLVTMKDFGRVLAYTYVIEYQKRNLPHVHLLLIIAPEDKLKTPEEIDEVIWARLPQREDFVEGPEGDDAYERLREIVGTTMMHGPCGIHNPNAPCMTDLPATSKLCNKKFPKEFREETYVGEDSYSSYKRPNNGDFIVKHGVKLDNRHVVPYSPKYSLKFGAHINVEHCASVKSVKYLYKYVIYRLLYHIFLKVCL